MSSECRIHLENYSENYCSGADVIGRIDCFLDDATSVRGIKIRLICREYNDWYESETYYDSTDKVSRTRQVLYSGENKPINIEQMLFGSDSGKITLPPGKHCFPFSFILPNNIPSSFDGPYGSISYYLEAVVDRPMAFDYEDMFSFKVKSLVDLNSFPQDLLPNNYTDEKTVCCWCCKGGFVSMVVDLPKNAFVPGEVVNFKVTFTNLSNINMGVLKLNLEKEITYKVTSPDTKFEHDTENILIMREHGVGANGEYTYNLQMIIPEHLEVPNFSSCTLFTTLYILRLTAVMEGCTYNLDIYIYPKMGHIHTNSNQNPATPPLGFVTSPTTLPYLPSGLDREPPSATFPVSGFTQPNPPPYPGNNEKPVYPSGRPTAPSTFGDAPPESAAASAPPATPGTSLFRDNYSDSTGASAPLLSSQFQLDIPPPSYNDAVEK